MAFKLFFGEFELPVAPPKIDMKINDQNKTVTLANMKEINILKAPGLTDITFNAPVPLAHYPWANVYVHPQEMLGKLEELKTSQKPFQFIVSREYDNGNVSFSTNLTVGLADYHVMEDAEDCSDMTVEINLKQWTEYGAKIVYVKDKDIGTGKPKPNPSPNKPSNNNKKKTYTVKHGDSLWEIAKTYLGNGSKYKELYNLNKDMMDKRNEKEGTSKYTIYTGQVIRLG